MGAGRLQRLFNSMPSGQITNAEFPRRRSVSIHSLIADFHDITALVVPIWEIAASLLPAIEKSRLMLTLSEDWDDEGSPAYEEQTWQRAVDFMLGTAIEFWRESGIIPEAPRIRKGPLESIDLHWLTPKRELLINVPATANASFDFYGDDRHGGHQVKGELDPNDSNHWLMHWLTV